MKVYVPKWRDANLLIDEAMQKQIAALVTVGSNVTSIMQQTGLKRAQVNRIIQSEGCKRYIREIGESALVTAKAEIKKEVAKLAPLVIETLRKHLSESNLQAIPHALKILGFSENEMAPQDTNITVSLDLGQTQPKKVTPDIEVTGLEVDDAV